eukprot:TRINITY_DN4695_c0_g2_i2.p1 TRINITY_DN4695_c0_g2~~TRINITY_DN4695_c0_g2_i2.p1  ORF type:complete len:312 (+),score=68.54 TRINITY_DN4695_c0_g2_i2:106-936(+)
MAPPMAALHCTWALSCLMVEIASRALLLPHLDTCETRVTAEGACMTGRLKEYCPRTLSTYALTMFRHEHQEGDRSYSIDFWDTAGQEQFNKLHASYYYQANACILTFDVTSEVTYKNLQQWYSELRHYCPDIPVICVANTTDADPAMTKESFYFPKEDNLFFYFVSAADGTNVVRVFTETIRLAIKSEEEPADKVMAETMKLLRDEDTSAPVPKADEFKLNKLRKQQYDKALATHGQTDLDLDGYIDWRQITFSKFLEALKTSAYRAKITLKPQLF